MSAPTQHIPRRGRIRSARLRVAALIATGLALVLAPSCVVTAGLHVVGTPNVTFSSVDYTTTYDESLTAVAAVSPSNVWATGVSWVPNARVGTVPQPLTLHWDGRSWRIIAAPGLAYAALADVVAVAGNDVWAVGYQADGGPITVVPLLLHYNGQRWTEVAAPPLPNWASLWGISAVSAHDIWAVGGITVGDAQGPGPTAPLTLHFDGRTWRQVPFPAVPGLSAGLGKVAASAAGAVYAIGGSPGHVVRWNGATWTSLPTTGIPTDAELRDVAVTGTDVWVVGDRANAAGPIEALAWHLDGIRWSPYRIDTHPGAVLNGVHATTAHDVWAAGTPGTDGTGDGVLLTRWNGQRWQPAFRIRAVPQLRGLADVTTSGGHVFGVGGTTRTLVVQN